jgi:hypothetical protein
LSKKWVLFSFLLLFLLAVSFYLMIQSGSISEKVKKYAEESLQSLLGRPIQVERAEVGLFPPSVRLKGVVTKEKGIVSPSSASGEAAPILAAEEIRIYFSPWSFFTESFLIQRIDIQSPSLHLDAKVLGETPFVLNRRSKTSTESLPPVIVRSIQIRDGRLSYQGEEAIKELSLKKINASIESDFKMSRFEIELSEGEGEVSTEKMQKQVDRLEANLVVHPDKIDFKKVFVASNKIVLRAEGVVRKEEKDPLDLRFEAQLPLEELDLASLFEGSLFAEKKLAGEMTLHAHLAGSLPKVAVAGKVALPRLVVDGTEVGSFASDLSYQEDRWVLSSFAGEVFSGSYTGNAQGPFPLPLRDPDRSKDRPEYRVSVQYKQLSLEKAKKILFAGDPEAPRSFEGILLNGDFSLLGHGGTEENWVAEGHLIAKRHSLFSAPVSEKSDRLDRLISLVEGGEIDWKWSDRRWTFAPATLHLPGTEATFQGEWAEGEWRLETQIQSSEMQKITEALDLSVTGRMNLQGRLSGKGALTSLQGAIQLDQWTLLKQPFGTFAAEFIFKEKEIVFNQGSLKAPLKPSPERAPVEKASIEKPSMAKTPTGTPAAPGKGIPPDPSPPYRFKGRLSLADPVSPLFDFEVEAASADPQEFLTLFKQSIPLQTRATGRLSIKGTPKAFSVHGPLVLSKGSLYGERFDRGKVVLTVTEKDILFQKTSLEQGKNRIEGEGEIGYGGTYRLVLRAARLEIDETHFFESRIPLLSGRVALEVSGKGTFKKPVLKAVAAVQNFQYDEMEAVRGTVKVDWKGPSVRVEGTVPEKKFFLSAEISLTEQTPFSFQSRFHQLEMDPFFKSRLSGPLSSMLLLVSGEMKGSGKLSRLDQTNLVGSFTEVQAYLGGYPIQNDGPFNFSSKEGAFKFERARFKGDNTALEFTGALTVFKEWDLFVNGEADLNLIKFFTREIASGKGKAYLDLRISDRWEQPQVRGALTLQNGTVRTATLSQTIHLSAVEVLFNERQLVLETFEGEMGRGRFSGAGKADLTGFGIGSFSFLLTLEGARVHLLPDLSATVEGELLFQRNGKSQTLQGELALKKASYEKRIDVKSLVVNSGKTRDASFEAETPVIGRTTLNVHLYGKEEIWINNNVAKIPLDIDLFVKGTFDQPLLIGRIDLPEGHVYFRKNDFEILSGSLEFLNSDKIDPTFDIKAKTEVRNFSNNIDYAIDLSLTGTLSQFTLTLISFPSLPEADILSLLALGKTNAEIAQTQKGGGGNEATSFVVSELLELEPVQKLTGIDRIQVDPYTDGTKSSSGTRLTAEKSLLEGRLLVIYSTTLDPSEEDLIRMVYEVNKNVSLVGKRDDKGQIGGDLRFRFEFR